MRRFSASDRWHAQYFHLTECCSSSAFKAKLFEDVAFFSHWCHGANGIGVLPRVFGVAREAMVVFEAGFKHPPHLPLMEHNHSIQAFSPNGTAQPLGAGILPS